MTFCYRKRIYHPSGVSLIAKGDGESARLAFGASLTLICFVATFCAPATAQEADIEINTESLAELLWVNYIRVVVHFYSLQLEQL